MATDRPAAGKAVGKADGGPQAGLGGRKASPQALAREAREKPPEGRLGLRPEPGALHNLAAGGEQ